MPSRRLILLLPILLAALTALPGGALALDLDTAKDRGLVGERPDGYVGVVEPAPDVRDLVARINNGRRDKYRRVATENGTTLDAVEAIAGRKLIKRAAPDHMVMTEDGNWVAREAL